MVHGVRDFKVYLVFPVELLSHDCELSEGFEGLEDWGGLLGWIGDIFIIFKGISFIPYLSNMKDQGWLLFKHH